MNCLSAFLKQNALQAQNKFVPISDRFIGEDGKPMLWELQPLQEKENARIRESCMTRDYSKSAVKGGKSVNFDSTLYVQRLLAASVVYPDLKDATLQASYNVIGEVELLVEMLYSDEFSRLQDEVDDFGGYISRDLESDKAEVKNS